MSQYVAELCHLLIADNFGELYAIIFSFLVNHGRQPIPRIVRHTKLNGKQVRHGLAVLIQQHLIYHNTSLDDGYTFYEANWRNAYYLLRSGKIIQLVESRLGGYAGRVMEVLLQLGHARVSYLETISELMEHTGKKDKQRKRRKLAGGEVKTENDGLQVEGVDDADADAEGEAEAEVGEEEEGGEDDDTIPPLHPTLNALASHGFIMRVRDAHFQSPGDLQEDAAQTLRGRSDIRALKGKRQEEAIINGVENLIRERTDGNIKTAGPDLRAEARGRKRKVKMGAADTNRGQEEEGVEKARKRLKVEMDDGESDDERMYGQDDMMEEDDYDEHAEPLDSNMILRPNYTKLDVSLRNAAILDFAREKTTPQTAKVYAALLARIETRTMACRNSSEYLAEGEEAEQYSAAVSLQTIIDDLEAAGDVEGLGGVFGDPNAKGAAAAAPAEEEFPSRVRAFEVEQHLAYLAQEPYFFATRNISSGILSYTVEYRHLARHLRHLEIERLVDSQFGPLGVRITRILNAKGKLDEKTLQELSLISTRDLRIVLGQLEAGGFLELQEVPRDAQRQPVRTLYLWFSDPDRVATRLIEHCYKSMSRCFQRMAVEKEKVKSVLEKTERTDVRGNEERFLSQGELEALAWWRKVEVLFLGEVARLDTIVATLRDY